MLNAHSSIKYLLGLAVLFGSACGYPSFTSAMRTNFGPETRIESLCLRTDGNEIDKAVREYTAQSWRLSYISEYTSSARKDFISTLCFERSTR